MYHVIILSTPLFERIQRVTVGYYKNEEEGSDLLFL